MNEKDIAKVIAKQVQELADKRGTEIKIDFNISGQIVAKKGEDYEQIVNFAVPYEKLLVLALSKLNGVTLDSLVTEALLDDYLDTSKIKAEAVEAVAKIKGKQTRKMSGKLTIQSTVLEVADVTSCEYC